MKRLLFFLGRMGIIFLLSGLVILGLSQITFSSPTNWLGGSVPPAKALVRPMIGQQGVYLRIAFETAENANATLYIVKVPEEAFKYIEEKIRPGSVIPLGMLDLLIRNNVLNIVALLHPTDQTEIMMSGDSTYLFIVANPAQDTIRAIVSITLISHLVPPEAASRVSIAFIGVGVLSILYILPRIGKH